MSEPLTPTEIKTAREAITGQIERHGASPFLGRMLEMVDEIDRLRQRVDEFEEADPSLDYALQRIDDIIAAVNMDRSAEHTLALVTQLRNALLGMGDTPDPTDNRDIDEKWKERIESARDRGCHTIAVDIGEAEAVMYMLERLTSGDPDTWTANCSDCGWLHKHVSGDRIVCECGEVLEREATE